MISPDDRREVAEVWKDIPDYEGAYQVSDMGRVRSLDHIARCNRGTKLYRGRVIKPFITNAGYLRVGLRHHGDVHKRMDSVHRLVMLAFVGPSDLQVNHKDENKTNNRLDNLEYVTASKNQRYSNARAVEAYDLKTGETVKRYEAEVDVMADGFNTRYVTKCANNGERYRARGGLGWRWCVTDGGDSR